MLTTPSLALADNAFATQSPVSKPQHVLETAGLSFGFSHTFEALGGSRDILGAPFAGGLTDLEFRWAPKWRDCSRCGSFTAIYSAYSQTRPSSAPDLQGLSNLAAPNFHRWRQAYFEVSPLTRWRIKAGKVDANTEFAVVDAAADLSNASAGVSPTLYTMPSYPNGAASLNTFVAIGAGISAGAGVYRTIDGGRYYVAETGRRWQGSRPGRVAGGFWQQKNRTANTSGQYLTAEQTLLSRGAGRGLRAFGRISTANKLAAPASTHAFVGASWTGFGNRSADSTGLAFFRLSPVLEGLRPSTEGVLEAYYKIAIHRHLQAKLDLQHVQRPGGMPEAPSYWIVSLRVHFHLSTARE